MGEGDAVWQRAGVLGHVSDSTPLVIPYRNIGARGPKPNCARIALQSAAVGGSVVVSLNKHS